MNDILELENRRQLFDLILRSPGLHLRELQRQLDWVMGQLEYHLDRLEDAGLVQAEKERQFKRCFPSELAPADRNILGPLRQEAPRQVVLQLLQAPSTPSELSRQLKIPLSTLSEYLKTLLESDIATVKQEGRVRTYSIRNPNQILNNLVTYRPSFIDSMVDRFLDTWLEMYR
tara:strand:+ start:385 stop:903 length:519 start_codon:yes stop_codon:yes gene_type:complete